jgi:outer membrane receptor protein involved in Fe transport
MITKQARAAYRVAVAIALATSGVGATAWGQTSAQDGASSAPAIPVPEAQAAPGGAGTPAQLEEVVVTATKRKQSVRDIPESITVFTGDQLEKKGDLNLTEFIEESPGVVATDGGPGLTRISMRGIENDTGATSGLPPSVGIFIGDTAFTDPYLNSIFPDLSAFDLQSVEILKGPQGTLFGGAALSGAVRYILQDPVLGEWESRAFTQWTEANGGGDALTSGAAVNLPLYKDQLAARVDYVRRNYPGITFDGYTGQPHQDYGGGNQVRAIVLWQPTPDLRLKVTHLTQDFLAKNELTQSSYPDGPREQIDETYPTPTSYNFRLDNVEANYSFSNMKLTGLWSSLQKNISIDTDGTAILVGTPPPGYPQPLTLDQLIFESSRAFSEELRLQSNGDGPFKWLLGAYLFNHSNQFELRDDLTVDHELLGSDSALGTDPAALAVLAALGLPASNVAQTTSLLDGFSNAKSWEHAAFLNLSYTLWHRLELEAASRFYDASVGGGYIASGVLLMAENNLSDLDTQATVKEKGICPKFSATFHFNRDILLYAAASKGFQFGGVNDFPHTATNGIPAVYKSSSLWNYEIGLRTNWLHNTLHADITPYYIDWRNPVISQTAPGAIGLGYTDNVGAAVARGVETTLLWNTPLRGLSVSLNNSFSSSHTTVPFASTNNKEIEPGQEMPGANHLQGTASISYLRPLWAGMHGGANAGYTFVGKGWNDINHDVQVNGFGTLRAGLLFEGSVYGVESNLAINATNLLNVTRPNSAFTSTALVTQSSIEEYTLNPPREISVRLGLEF